VIEPRPDTPYEADLRRHDVLTAIQSLLTVVVIATFVVTFLIQPFRIPTGSMDPTLHIGDFLLMDKQAFAPHGAFDALLPSDTIHRGDVAVFHYPVDPAVIFVKRVVGLPGDRLRMHNGRLYINGQAVNEPYAFYGSSTPDSFRDNFPSQQALDGDVDPAWWRTLRRDVRDGELYVPADRYFVMGDNRNDSEDSRYWGFVSRSAFVGRPLLVYFSLGEPGASRTFRQRIADVVRNERIVR
jgi:signal peptidase I